jgi:hypothetical protein
MAKEPEPIKVTASTNLADLLERAGTVPVVLERNGVRYRLARETEDIWAGYNPKNAKAALTKAIGTWADIDADIMVADIYRWREEGSRPANRP